MIDPAAAGRGFEVQVEFELATQVRSVVEEFEKTLTAYAEVVEVRRMFGAPDYLAMVAVQDLTTYERFMTEKLRALPGLGQLQSRIAMKTLKSSTPSRN